LYNAKSDTPDTLTTKIFQKERKEKEKANEEIQDLNNCSLFPISLQ